jgi:hypothetical protein
MKLWHGIVAAVALVVIVALLSMTMGSHFIFGRGLR